MQGYRGGNTDCALKDYFLSSIFLRMTGAQEQKLKCICWEIATHNYDFRYEYMKKVWGILLIMKSKKEFLII